MSLRLTHARGVRLALLIPFVVAAQLIQMLSDQAYGVADKFEQWWWVELGKYGRGE